MMFLGSHSVALGSRSVFPRDASNALHIIAHLHASAVVRILLFVACTQFRRHGVRSS